VSADTAVRCLWFAVVLLAAPLARADQRVEMIDARSTKGELVAITDEAVELRIEGKNTTLPRSDVAEIWFADAPDAIDQSGGALVTTAAGDVLNARWIAGGADELAFDNPLAGKVGIKFSLARAIYLPGPGQTARHVINKSRELKMPAPTTDALIIDQKDKGWTPVSGVLVGIGLDKVAFRWKDADRTIDRSSVRAIRLAAVEKPPSQSAGVLIGRQGCRVAFSTLETKGKVVAVETLGLGPREIPRDRVAAIQFHSGRVVKLTDLTPVSVKEVPFFDMKFPFRVNRAVSGKPLRLAGETYAAGLGVHSFCELTYDVAGRYKSFIALVGIDDAVRPAGSAALTFLGDGKPLCEPLELTGRTGPAWVRVENLAGVRQFTIRVDYGPDGIDVADHVNLVAPRFIK